MESVQTKTKEFTELEGKCIAQIVAVSVESKWRIYVAWEWEDMAKKGVFGIAKSRSLYDKVNEDNIEDAADYGADISGTPEAKKVFKHIF